MQKRLSIGLLVAIVFLAGAAAAFEGMWIEALRSQTAPVIVMLPPETGPVVRGHGWALTFPPGSANSEDDPSCVQDGYDSCSDGDADNGGSGEESSGTSLDTDPI